MAARGLGIDEGTATVKAVEVELKDGALVPARAIALPAMEEGGFAPATLQATLRQAGFKSKGVVLGLTGKDLVIKYQPVPPVADFQLKKIVAFELEEIKKQSGDELAGDFNVMPSRADLTNDDIVMLALSREQRIEERSAALQAAGLATLHFTPNAVALFHAFRVFGPATSGDVLVVSIGKSASDFAVIRDGDLLYARSVSTGGDVLTDAIADQFGVSKAKAESLKLELGDLSPRDKRSGLSQQSEKVSYALEGAAGRLFSMVQSTLQLAKSQMQLNQLNISKVWLTGGSAAMKGLDEYLAGSLGAPVQLFDPLADAGLAVEGAGTLDLVVALGLAVMAADDEAWSVELLTAAERKRRDFTKKHVFTLAAILLVAVYLGLYGWKYRERHQTTTTAAARIGAESRKRSNNASQFENLRTERAELATKVDLLEKRKAAGDGLVRALGMLVTELPEDLWAASLAVEQREVKSALRERSAKKPFVVVEGGGKPRKARGIDEVYSSFIDAVGAPAADPDYRPPFFEQRQAPKPGVIEYTLTMSWLEEPPVEAEAPAPEPAPKPAKKAGGH